MVRFYEIFTSAGNAGHFRFESHYPKPSQANGQYPRPKSHRVVAHNYMTAQYTIKEAGYAFLYIANENATQVDVYFDDVVMTQSKNNVIQSNEYYPFGMQTATSWTRENTTGNNFLANAGTELNTLTQLYDLDFRNFDPILGRLHQVDPLADNYGSWSPYKYAYNSPVNWNDPSGAADSPGSAGPGFDPNNAFDRADRYMSRMNSPTKMYGAIGDDDIYGSGVSYTSGGFWVESETTTTIGPNSKNNNSETRTSTSKFWVPGGGDGGGQQTQTWPTGKCPTCVDLSTVGNLFYIYGGPNNPKSNNGDYNYDLPSKNVSDKTSLIHDQNYDKKRAVGPLDLFLNFSVINDDISYVKSQFKITGMYLSQFNIGANYFIYTPVFDPVTQKPIALGTAFNALLQGVGLGAFSAPKIIIYDVGRSGPFK